MQTLDAASDSMPNAQSNGAASIFSDSETCGRMEPPWHCVWTKPGQEYLADHSLRSDGFPTYLPLHSTKKAIEPLFPRYMFAMPDENGQWVRMLYLRGVAGILRKPGGMPLVVPARDVNDLLAQCAPNRVIYPPEPKVIKAGDAAVRALQGPLAGFTGICTKTTRDRVWLLLELLGRPTEVGFERTAVEAAT